MSKGKKIDTKYIAEFKTAVIMYTSENCFIYRETRGNADISSRRKGNRMENGAMGSFFGRLEVEMIYGEMFETVNGFVHRLREYIDYRKND